MYEKYFVCLFLWELDWRAAKFTFADTYVSSERWSNRLIFLRSLVDFHRFISNSASHRVCCVVWLEASNKVCGEEEKCLMRVRIRRMDWAGGRRNRLSGCESAHSLCVVYIIDELCPASLIQDLNLKDSRTVCRTRISKPRSNGFIRPCTARFWQEVRSLIMHRTLQRDLRQTSRHIFWQNVFVLPQKKYKIPCKLCSEVLLSRRKPIRKRLLHHYTVN